VIASWKRVCAHKYALKDLGTGSFSFEMPMDAVEGPTPGPEVSTQDVEAIMYARPLPEQVLESEPMHAASSTEPIFLNSEPTRTGRKRKAKDMSGLADCFCGERAKPDDVESIRCRRAGCATIWVCYCATFDVFMANSASSIIFNVLAMRMQGRRAGYVSHACVMQARKIGVARFRTIAEACVGTGRFNLNLWHTKSYNTSYIHVK
jgi:hypothetical protein